MNTRTKHPLASLLILVGLATSIPQAVLAQEFDPGAIVTDDQFSNHGAFGGAAGVQKFLEVRGSVLANTNIDFLRLLKEPVDSALKAKLDDPNANLGRLRTAAELIYDAAQVAQINPQVILVTLQKEQSLIDGVFPDSARLQRRLDRAMGFACPDSGTCGDLFLGFYFQIFGNLDAEGNRYLGAARSLGKSFYTESGGVRVGRGPAVDEQGRTFGSSPKVRITRVGDTITVDNTQGPPYNAAPQQTFALKNSATAALYRYTPHVYNGNYNFFRFFHLWFKYPNGSLLKLTEGGEVFYVDNGARRPVSGTVMAQRGLDVTKAFIVSQTELNEYDLAKPLPPAEGTLISPSSGGIRYVVAGSVLHPVSDFIAGLRKLNIANTLYLPESEVNAYEIGLQALPPEDTLIKKATSPEVYIVQNQVLRPISGFVFKQRAYKFSNVITAQDSEFTNFVKAAPLPPLDGTLVKSPATPLVYYTALGQKFPIPYFVFVLRKFKFSNVVALSDDEIDHLSTGDHLAPLDGTLLKAKGSATVYLVEAGNTHYITGFLFKHRGYKFSQVVEVTDAELALLHQNSPLYLADETLIKLAGDPTVFVIAEGYKLPLTAAAFKTRNYKFTDVVEVTRDEADRYPTGNPLTQ